MPVRFEKSSEYDRKYKWVDSYLSKNFEPSVDQMFPPAGVASIDIGNINEPKLQSRRKPFDLTRTSTTNHDSLPSKQDDYILVGDQSKFAPSVKYRMLGKEKENLTPATASPPESKDHKHQSKSKHNSHEGEPVGEESHKYYCKKHGKVHHHPSKRSASSPPVTSEDNGLQPDCVVENGGHPPPTVERSPPPAPRERDIAPVLKRKPENYMPRPTKPRPNKPIVKSHPPPRRKEPKTKTQVPKLSLNVKEPEAPVPVVAQPQRKPPDLREKRKGKLNEFVQTDLAKGVTDSGQEATDNYAMKYRAGCPPPRPKGPKRLSEYQMQFQWKKGIGASPMLAAEQIVYNNNPHLAPYSNPHLPPKVSEYNQAFKKYDYKPVPIGSVQPKRAKLQRSKSMEAITPDRLRAAGMRSGKCTEEDKRLLRESANPTHLLFPHGKVKNVGSEYAMNYKNPMRYSYDDGVWKGADPPHIQPSKTPVPVNAKCPAHATTMEEELEPSTSWYKEVMELRNKALEYKQRARGTHFSRAHLAQLYAQQADLWDTVSNSSTLSALSLESAGAMADKKVVPMDDTSCADPTSASQKAHLQPKAAPPPKLAWANEQTSPTQSKSTSVVSIQGSPPGSAGTGSDDTLVVESSQQGRMPTPKFRKEHDSAGYKWRHHLDRTTPAVGGALLTSPPQRRKTKGRSKSESALRLTASAPKVSASWAGPLATSGMPTRDSHVLVDEEASTDRPLSTKFTQSPPIDKHGMSTERISKKHPLGVAVMPTLRETIQEMQSNSSAGATMDDDAISLSARSVASSCSLASEVLERARNRRDEFWGNNTKKPSRS